MSNKSHNKKKNNKTLIWSVLVLLIITVVVLLIYNNNRKKEDYETVILSEAQKVLDTIKIKKAENPDFDAKSVNQNNIEQLLGISGENFEQLKIIVDAKEIKIFLVGKNEIA